MAGELTDFLANLTEGAASLMGMIGDAGAVFMEPPFVIVPIAGVTFLSFKIGMYILRKVKNGA